MRVRHLLSPIYSLLFASVGVSLLGTLLTLKLRDAGESSFMIGFMFTSFFGGYVLGAFKSEKFIIRVGGIRAFSCFASVLAAIAITHGLVQDAWFWVILRFAFGFCNAGLFIVIESWLLNVAEKEARGTILSLYMLSVYLSFTLGQYVLRFIDTDSLVPFAVIGILTSISIVPLTTTTVKAPEFYDEGSVLKIKELIKLSPAAFLGCIGSGLILSSIYSIFPMSIKDYGFSLRYISQAMTVVMLGGTLLQLPIGRLSDRYSRRKVLICLLILCGITCGAAVMNVGEGSMIFALCLFLLGGLSFTLYPISINIACDRVDPKHLVAATAGLLVFYSFGSMAGPLLAPITIDAFGSTDGIFYYFIIVCTLTLGAILYATRKRKALTADEQEAFTPSVRTTPVALEFEPRLEANEEPEEEDTTDEPK